MKIEIEIPDALHEETRDLVRRFAGALAAKLRKAEEKYDYSDGWTECEWVERGECNDRLIGHLQKGDPRDVAIYCAFLWHHGAKTKLVLHATGSE